MGNSKKKAKKASPPFKETSLPKSQTPRTFYFVCAGLALATIAVYAQVYTHDFQVLDDDSYVLQNAVVTAGLTGSGIVWAFTTGAIANWHPLTWLSHMLDCQLFGVNAGPQHLVNVLFHTLNTVLLFLVLRRMTGAMWRSAFVAGLFALHPIHVESVAWISERKDVLSTFFWMLTMGGYVLYVERPSVRRYGLVLVPFALGLMAKPMLVTLPCVLLLLDYWPLRRFEPVVGPKNKITPPNYVAIIGEKVPLFALTVASSFITFIVQQRGGAVLSLDAIPLGARLANALVSYVRYVGKMFWPQNLSIYYPNQAQNLPGWLIAVVFLVLVAVSVAVLYSRKSHPCSSGDAGDGGSLHVCARNWRIYHRRVGRSGIGGAVALSQGGTECGRGADLGWDGDRHDPLFARLAR